MLRIIDRMRSSTQRMSRMIGQILDFTRTRLAGGLELRFEPYDLRDTVLRIVDELRAAHPGRTVDVHCSPLPGTWDRDRMEQVFSNLIGNALNYGADKPVTVTGQADEHGVHVDVHNHGPPIPEEVLPTLFSAFRRGERDSRTSKTAGLGLGLYISNEVVRAHGGTIDVRSNQSEGTTFRVNLPPRR
jgi:signal transduction histidine kinase